MKKLILLCLLAVSFLTVHAQQLSGVSKFNVGTCFTSVDWEVSYSFEMVAEGVAIQFYDPQITVSSSSEYYTKGQRYSKQSLGLSSWPDENQDPQNMVISFKVSHADGYANSINSQPCINGKFAPTIVLRKSNVKNWENISIGDFKVVATERMMYNNRGSVEVDNIIEGKKNSSSSSASGSNPGNNNPVANQTKTANTGMPANTSGNDPLAHFETDSKPKSNPMTNTNSGLNSVDNFNKGYAQGQQIADVAVPIAQGLADIWNRRVEKENAFRENTAMMHKQKRQDYTDFCNETNTVIFKWPYFKENVLQRLPLMLENESPSWASILGTGDFTHAFGKEASFIVDNFNPIETKKKEILFYLTNPNYVQPLETSISFKSFYTVQFDRSVRYKYSYVLNNVKLPKNRHTLEFIYNENKKVIGITLNNPSSYDIRVSPMEYYKDIISKLGTNYVMLDASTFLLKDKLIFFNYDAIHMYDLNYMGDQLYYNIANVVKANPSLNFETLKYIPGIEFNETFNIDQNNIKWKPVSPYYLGEMKKRAYYTSYINNKQLVVKKIVVGSPCDKAGIMEGDVIKAVNNISTPNPLFFRLAGYAYGASGNMNITYLRGGKEYKTTINLN